MEDLFAWNDTLVKLNEILGVIGHRILNFDSLDKTEETWVPDDSYIVLSILQFLCKLLKAAKDKRYFLSFKVRRLNY